MSLMPAEREGGHVGCRRNDYNGGGGKDENDGI